jgi:hypothetical protein
MAAIDDFLGRSTDHSYTAAAVVTPHDTNELTYVTRALHLGTGGGTLKVTMQDGTDITITNPATGWHRIRVRRVFSTGTATVANIVAFW